MSVDVAYGGMFYVIADAAPLGLRLTPDEGREIVRIGEMIKAAAREQLPVSHPLQPEVHRLQRGPTLGPAAQRGCRHAQRGGHLDGRLRLGAA